MPSAEPTAAPAPAVNTHQPQSSQAHNGNGQPLPQLVIAALGIVYGDIGTSPLYAVRECFFGAAGLPVNTATVLGVLSLILWSLILVVSIKYLVVVMRADNNGEGGILALLALIDPWRNQKGWRAAVLVGLGIFGASLLLGDGMITPAISVLSAVEGMEVVAAPLKELVVPITIVILLLLFTFQRHGTARIGALFGPIMVVWFIVLGALGLTSIVQDPQILLALNPWEAVRLFIADPGQAFLVLGAVFLVVTGGEALYADMGHFGAKPIRMAWFSLVLPALLLNYFGQGAFILAHPNDAIHPFYNLVPQWLVIPMILLSTVVTVIASQAVISGTFSLVRQAIQLNRCPRLLVVQTSSEEIGQIYVPFMNWALLLGTLALVLGFETSSNLAAAYGVAVSATMVITTVLAFIAMRDIWKWPLWIAGTVSSGFLAFDIAFFSSNLSKVADGGWFPLAISALTLMLMGTWHKGRELYQRRTYGSTMPIDLFLSSLQHELPTRIQGTAVFLTSPGNTVPRGLLHHLKLNQVLHERVLLLTCVTLEVPRVSASRRLEVQRLSCGFNRVQVYYGFMQTPNIPVALKFAADQELLPDMDADNLTYYVDHATLVFGNDNKFMGEWRKRLYRFMARNSQTSAEYYGLPPGRSVELGIQVEL